MTTTQDIVARLWNLCHVLRDDGITYHQYVTELTYLLFLKMAEETGTEGQLPRGWRWGDLTAKDGVAQPTSGLQRAEVRPPRTHVGVISGRHRARDLHERSARPSVFCDLAGRAPLRASAARRDVPSLGAPAR